MCSLATQQQQQQQHPDCDGRRQARCFVEQREAACTAQACTQTHEEAPWTRATGGCCCYDAIATAPWEASEELNEFSPQLKRSLRRQARTPTASRGQDRQQAQETQAGPCPGSLHGNAQSGVSASLAASRVMRLGEISHTSVRRCSDAGEAPTPCLPSSAETKWRGVVLHTFVPFSGGIVILTGDSVDLFCARYWTTMAERTSTGLLTMMLEPTPTVAMTLPAEVREKLAELELELSEGKLTTPMGTHTITARD